MARSPELNQVTSFFVCFIFLMGLFVFIVFGQCLFWETVKANGANPPPNVFQWSKARVCGCEQMAEYGEWVGVN